MADTITAAGPRPCALDGCPNAFTPAGRGHGRRYCSDACRYQSVLARNRAAYRARRGERCANKRRWYNANLDRARGQMRAYHARHRDRELARQRAYRRANHDTVLSKLRRYNRTTRAADHAKRDIAAPFALVQHHNYCEALPVGTPTRPGQRVVALYEPWRGGWSVTAPSLAGEEARRLAASLSRREERLSRGAKRG